MSRTRHAYPSRGGFFFFITLTFAPSIVTQNPSEVSDGSLMSEKVPISALLPHKTQNNEDKDSSFQEHGVRRGTNHDK
jgi:hypothetical protein